MLLMKSILKYSLTGTTIAALLVVAAISIQTGSFDADAYVYPEGAPQEGLQMERLHAGLNTGMDRLYVVHITSGDPESQHERHSAMMGIQHAKAFQDAGKHVVVLLDVDGVRIADENRPAILTVQYEALKEFINDGGRVIACEHCVGSFAVDELLRGVEIDPHPYMPKLQRVLADAAVVLDY